MPVKLVPKKDLKSILNIIGEIRAISFEKDTHNGIDSEVCKMRIKWYKSAIYIFEREKTVFKRLKKLKIGDVIKIEGYFFNEVYPGKKSFASIQKIISFKKIGVISQD